MKSGSNVVPLPAGPAQRSRYELAFLPAALEIVETPPSPLGRAIAIVIGLVFCAALAWASLTKVDIIASAPGKIVAGGRTKVIQPFETGVVRAIDVQDGQAVKKGDVLIELDPTINAADRDHLLSDLNALQLEIARLRAALSTSADPLGDFNPPAGASPDLVSMQRQFLVKQVEEHQAKLASLDRQQEQKRAERETIAASIKKLNATIPVVQQRAEIYKALVDRGLGSRLTYLETLQQVIEQQQDLSINGSRYNEADPALAAITESRREADADYRRTLLEELAEAERKAAGIRNDLIKAEERTKLQILTAPIDGYVQQLAVHTIGGVVTPAQPLLVLVPADSHLEIEAEVSNADVGFIRPGQVAAIKVETFNFTRYGLLEGKVLTVSHDSMQREKPSSEEMIGSVPKGPDLVYTARISLDRTQMRIDENLVELTPGMAVVVEVKTGSRTLMNYLLSPLLRYEHDSLRER
ncbi:HlyD family type I secretion periplasmic adaptor subunit [Mesorhizobium sp. B2-3-11]|uniref:HlyD family type I secretion periplasmic adaptor subunit n=1 Tax=Mesorhizobium sp. B2-3-11 TaxID=2589953 RepID=UPI00112E7500|nr:HlyD family type I secretion periplasmic adaptor subunit [Mesorhizobium sp. B2-3-11]TPM07082.1 HlyD family type I secretion periplasmic adaptor subunit [Mesorhizobium sp. B2-3-11]